MSWAIRLDHPQRKRPMWDGNMAGRVTKPRRWTWRTKERAQAAVGCVTYSGGWVPTVVEVDDPVYQA